MGRDTRHKRKVKIVKLTKYERLDLQEVYFKDTGCLKTKLDSTIVIKSSTIRQICT